MNPKRISDSCVTLSAVMGPQHTNSLGNVHGGVIMKMVDEAAGFAAMRHARRPCVTVVMDSMTFMKPVRVGMLVTCNAELTYVGRTSMEIRVEVVTENPIEGVSEITNTAYLVFVALDDAGVPTPIPSLEYVTHAQKLRAEQAQERQAYRKARKDKEQS